MLKENLPEAEAVMARMWPAVHAQNQGTKLWYMAPAPCPFNSEFAKFYHVLPIRIVIHDVQYKFNLPYLRHICLTLTHFTLWGCASVFRKGGMLKMPSELYW